MRMADLIPFNVIRTNSTQMDAKFPFDAQYVRLSFRTPKIIVSEIDFISTHLLSFFFFFFFSFRLSHVNENK